MKTALFLACAISSFAALPPLAQSQREIQALLTDPHLQEGLGSAESIQEVIRTETGYVVMTQNYSMRVDVIYGETTRPGPVPFQLQFHPPQKSNGLRP